MNLSIGRRLALGFSALLALMLIITALAMSQLDRISTGTQDILGRSLRKERAVEEWHRLSSVGVRRTVAVAKSTDTRLEALFAEESKRYSERITDLMKEIDALADSAEEKALLESIAQKRLVYTKARDDVQRARREGHGDLAEKIFESMFLPASEAYITDQARLLEVEKATLTTQAAAVQAAEKTAWISLFAGALGALAVGIALAWLLTRSIVRPLHVAVTHARAIGARDLTHSIEAHGNDEAQQLIAAMGAMQTALRDVVIQVRDVTSQVAHASSEVAQGNADLSSRTESQAASLEQTSSAMKSITATVTENASNAREANGIAASAADVARDSGESVSRVVTTMGEIADYSRRIQDIISVIDGIAFQTNILALNAAVEAARAGEQGRGFAVVASEVRTLAQRSASAAKEIKQLITESVDKVQTGVDVVEGAGAKMQDLVASVARLRDIVSQISSAGEEQARGIGEVDQAIGHMDSMTQQNAALVEQAAAAAQTLQDQAAELARTVGEFRLPGAPSGGAGSLAPTRPRSHGSDTAPPLRRFAA